MELINFQYLGKIRRKLSGSKEPVIATFEEDLRFIFRHEGRGEILVGGEFSDIRIVRASV